MALVAVALIAVALIAGLDPGADSHGGRQKARGHARWIVAGDDLAALRDSNAGVARRFFDNRHTFVIGEADGTQDLVPPGYRSIPALSYASAARFAEDFRAGRIDPRVGAIVYDPESWTRTPADERRAPVAAMRRFTLQASQWGYAPIVAPGRDLALVDAGACTKQPGELLDSAYLRCGMTRGAVDADAFVVQAAPDELDLPTLKRFLQLGRGRLHSEAPGVPTIATLSTDPPSAEEPVYPIDLVRAAQLELTFAQGIMLNFTVGSIPLAASFLRDMERKRNASL